MAKRNVLKVIVVHWRDAATNSRWLEDATKHTLADVVSAGFLVNEDETIVRVALNHNEDGDFADIIAIPRCQIVKRKILYKIEIER